MNKKFHLALEFALTLTIVLLTSMRMPADTQVCGGVQITLPFTDVMGNPFFCQIAEAFVSGLTSGTSTTTYSPGDSVSRDQMAAFITRTQDSALRRGSQRAAIKQWATPFNVPSSARVDLGDGPFHVESDGADLWVSDNTSGDVKRVHASDGSLAGTWTGAAGADGVLIARGLVFVTGNVTPGRLYFLNPRVSPGAVTTLSSSLGDSPVGIATDGRYIWTGNRGGSVSRIDLDAGGGLTVTTNITSGFSQPAGVIYDGTSIWVADAGDNKLKKLDSNGAVIQSVAVGTAPQFPLFDGANIWVPNSGNDSVTVVRAKDGFVVSTLTGNGLNNPRQAAFDGQRILITNRGGDTVSMWKATDLTPIGTFSTGAGTQPTGACSDGINFWITLSGSDQLARF